MGPLAKLCGPDLFRHNIEFPPPPIGPGNLGAPAYLSHRSTEFS